MKYALINDLEQSAFIEGDDVRIGTESQCVKLFETEEAAVKYAASLLRESDWGKAALACAGDLADNELWEMFQLKLETFEYFHIQPVVD